MVAHAQQRQEGSKRVRRQRGMCRRCLRRRRIERGHVRSTRAIEVRETRLVVVRFLQNAHAALGRGDKRAAGGADSPRESGRRDRSWQVSRVSQPGESAGRVSRVSQPGESAGGP